MNSTMVHFGLGKSSTVDSIFIRWPSGVESLLDNIQEVNTIMMVKEEECLESTVEIPNYQLCNGDAVEIILPAGYDSYLWSNDEVGQIISIDSIGWYRVEMTKNGCTAFTSYFEVTEEVTLSQNDVLNIPDQVACKGDLVKLKAYPGIAYAWSTNDNTQEIEVLESGKYSLTLTSNCGDYSSKDVEVFFADTKSPIIINDTVMVGESAMFIGAGQQLNWYQNKNDIEPIATGSEFMTPELFTSQTYFVGEPTSGNGYVENVMPNVPLNEISDSTYSTNDTIHFNVLQDLHLNAIDVRTQIPGVRKIILVQGQNELATYEVDLVAGVNTIAIDYQFETGDYQLTTDPIVNQMNIGSQHPSFSFSELYTPIDRSIYGYLDISGSQRYEGITSYFFNWDVEYGNYYCEPRIAIEAIVKMPVSVSDKIFQTNIYPNPTSGQITIVTDFSAPYEIQLIDLAGRQLSSRSIFHQQELLIDLPDTQGIYFIKLTNREGSIIEKVYRY